MNRSIIRPLTIIAVLALAGVGLEHTIATLFRASGSAATVVAQPTATATVAASAPAQLQVVTQPTATATATAPPPAQVQVATQPTAGATVAAPPPAPQVEVEGNIIAVDAAAGTITIQDEDDDGGPATVVSVGAAGSYQVGQEVEVVGTLTAPGGSAATVQAQAVQVEAPEAAEAPESAEAPEAAEPPEAPEPPDND
jgi:hypothetical protein